jgi:hypothetical protein
VNRANRTALANKFFSMFSATEKEYNQSSPEISCLGKPDVSDDSQELQIVSTGL